MAPGTTCSGLYPTPSTPVTSYVTSCAPCRCREQTAKHRPTGSAVGPLLASDPHRSSPIPCYNTKTQPKTDQRALILSKRVSGRRGFGQGRVGVNARPGISGRGLRLALGFTGGAGFARLRWRRWWLCHFRTGAFEQVMEPSKLLFRKVIVPLNTVKKRYITTS